MMFPKGVGKARYVIFYFVGVKEMNKEMILKLLKSLGVKIGTNEGEVKEEDAIKLVEDIFNAGNLGLVQKRDELLANEIKLKEKITGLENAATETAKKQNELEAQLKKSNPEEFKAFYDVKAKQLEDKHKTELEKINAELAKYKESHYERIKNDALTEATKDIQFLDGLKDGFIALAMSRNRFEPIGEDSKTVFINQNKETIEAVIRQLALTKEGKAYIKNGNQGSGAQGADNKSGTGAGGNKKTRAEFDALSNQEKMDFTSKGGAITE
jgi:hypothetical protein